MKIAIVTETFLPSTDGIVTRLTKAIDHFVAEGHDVIVIAPDLGVLKYNGVKVVGIPPITFPFYRYRKWGVPSRKVQKIIADYNPDVVHAVNPLLLATSAVKASVNLNIPLVSSYHTHLPKYLDFYTIYKPARPVLWWYIRKQHRHADVNLVTSEAMKRELLNQGIERLDVIPRGVDIENRHPKFKSETMRNRLTNGAPNKKLLVFIGRLAAEKDIHLIKPLLDRRDDVCLAIVGDGPARRDLEKTFEDTNTVFTGFMHGEELSQAYASSDAFIFPSVSETLGLVILEGMASGLPVIAARSGPTEEQIVDGKNGLLFTNGDLTSLERAIDLLDDDHTLNMLKMHARQEAEQYSWEKASQKLLDYYQKAIDVH